MIFKKKKRKVPAGKVDRNRLPRHIALIMDGNGRWARNRGLPRKAGHAVGAETFRSIATYCKEIGIDYFTVYAFSTENWKRPTDEINAIMGLLEQYLLEAIEKMEADRVRLHILGDLTPLSPKLKALCARTEEISKTLEGLQVNLCLNYGGRDEILHAARTFAAACRNGERTPDDLTEEMFSGYLYSKGIPDPDLIIRPSGEVRISNFLLWQGAYAEYYFTDVLWPDFDKAELDRAIADYQHRSRRFGGIGGA
ncbi:MAG: isoprenyl transferase [Oscillospiraceae bacterium]|jgi:undecaprenyl diphosphate synthase